MLKRERRENEKVVEWVEIKLVIVGKLEGKYLVRGVNEYLKRLNSYAEIEIIEVPDERASERLSDAEMLQIKERKGQRILGKINDSEYVFVLAISGRQLSSEESSKEVKQLGINGKSSLTFVIDGSLGLNDSVLQRNNQQVSFGRLTCPHQLTCLVLVEQIYRGLRIMKGEPYHK